MESGFIKDIAISLAIALVVVAVVNVIGEFSVRPRTEMASVQPSPAAKETAKETATATTAEKAPVVQEATAASVPSLANLLGAYTPEAGIKAFRKCKSCHTANKGGANRIGPNLWNVVGREKGAVEGFKYSDAMKLKGGTWSYTDLYHFLANPRVFVRGTKMSLKGFSDPVIRASLIGFLRASSDDPLPLPE